MMYRTRHLGLVIVLLATACPLSARSMWAQESTSRKPSLVSSGPISHWDAMRLDLPVRRQEDPDAQPREGIVVEQCAVLAPGLRFTILSDVGAAAKVSWPVIED